MHIDRCGNIHRQKCAKESGKEVKIQEFRHRDTTNVEPEMYDYTSYNLNQQNSNEKLRKNLEATPGKHSIDSLQHTAVLRTSHIIRKVLQCGTRSLTGGVTAGSTEVPGRKPVTRDDDDDDDDDDDNSNNNNNNNMKLNIYPFKLLFYSTRDNIKRK
jgi:hypothetical protein